MIKDSSIFCFARTGDIDGVEYPAMLDSSRDIDRSAGSISVLGRRIVLDEVMSPFTVKKYYTDQEGEICLIPDALSLVQRPKKLLDRIFKIRESVGHRPLIYAPSIGEPYLIPFLVYAGVSLFDDLYLRKQSLRGIRYGVLGAETNATVHDTFERNQGFVSDMMKSLRRAISSQILREVVEKYQFNSKGIEILRALDSHFYAESERYFPSRTPYIKANSGISMNRPDLVRYRTRVAMEYEKPEDKDVCLILPCSARKPYSSSSLHRKILGRISNFIPQLHRLVVTSPVGLVPEELEGLYPARFYDIPVIGEWYEDEKAIIVRMLSSFFSRNRYRKVIAYVDQGLGFIKDALPPDSSVLIGNPRDDGMLSRLVRAVSEELPNEHPNGSINASRLMGMARFQFGKWIDPMLKGMRYTRSYNQDMLALNGRAMIVYNESLGKLSMTRAMGTKFMEAGRFTVSIDDFKPTANIYAVGVKDVTDDVRPEDEVAIAFEGELRGVGVAKMPAPFMRDLKKGIAVKVRN